MVLDRDANRTCGVVEHPPKDQNAYSSNSYISKRMGTYARVMPSNHSLAGKCQELVGQTIQEKPDFTGLDVHRACSAVRNSVFIGPRPLIQFTRGYRREVKNTQPFSFKISKVCHLSPML